MRRASPATAAAHGLAAPRQSAEGQGDGREPPPKDIKAMVLAALDDIGAVAWLRAQARENPRAFLFLMGKVAPLPSGSEADGPLKVEIVDLLAEATRARHEAP